MVGPAPSIVVVLELDDVWLGNGEEDGVGLVYVEGIVVGLRDYNSFSANPRAEGLCGEGSYKHRLY